MNPSYWADSATQDGSQLTGGLQIVEIPEEEAEDDAPRRAGGMNREQRALRIVGKASQQPEHSGECWTMEGAGVWTICQISPTWDT